MYNKQTWLDEIPDMTKPIYDASGKQKTDPQTGRPLFELVQVGTRITSNRLNTMEGGIEEAHTLVEQLAMELGGNFVATINGTMGLECSAQGLKASWTSGVAYVGGRRYQVAAGEMPLNPTQGQYLYVDVEGVVKKTTSQTTAKKGLLIFYVSTDTSGVISTTDHRINVSLEEILKKLKDIEIEDAVTGGASGLMTGADAKFVRVDGETKTGAQEKADAVKDYVESRLDTSERGAVALQPGLQVIQGKRNAPFNLNSIKGRTLVNALGRAGRFSNLSDVLTQGNHSVAISSGNKIDGDNALLLNCGGQGGVQNLVRLTNLTFENDSRYVCIVNAKATAAGTLHSELYGSRGSVRDQNLTTEWKKVVYRFIGTSGGTGLHFWNSDAASNAFYIDGVRLFKVSEAEYTTATDAELIAKYPYVDSVQPVRNPYAIRYGENLLPPFYEWTRGSAFMLSEGYAGVLKNAINDAIAVSIPFKTEVEYTYSAEHTGAIAINAWDIGGNLVEGKSLVPYTTNQSVTFKVPIGTAKLEAYFSNIVSDTQTLTEVSIKNPMLTIGTTAKPFKPREDAMLALQTDLYADPLTGATADEVFEKDGQYFKLAKWKSVVLDGGLAWVYGNGATGYKWVNWLMSGQVQDTASVSKYDGKVLGRRNTSLGVSGAGPDYQMLRGDLLSITISNTDSGWGDSYTPTTDEIKAYFMGWKMYTDGQPALTNTYNGTGTKKWVKIGYTETTGVPAEAYSTTLPTNLGYVNSATPYQLVYQLATPTVEPITSEGQLTLIEGNNQVEVGTGLVVRENIKPVYWGNTQKFAYVNRVGSLSPDSPLKNKAKKIIRVYKDNKDDTARWTIISDATAYGIERATYGNVDPDYDPSAAYTVTYLMLDTSPVASFVGSVSENEKALLTDLVQDVQQANARLSVVESKKAEKDSPAWITPTLLNGWVDNGSPFYTSGYYKDGSGIVNIVGVIKSGSISDGTDIFKFPAGYRPRKNLKLTVSTYGGAVGTVKSGTIEIMPTGEVQVDYGISNTFLILDGLSFLAEQ